MKRRRAATTARTAAIEAPRQRCKTSHSKLIRGGKAGRRMQGAGRRMQSEITLVVASRPGRGQPESRIEMVSPQITQMNPDEYICVDLGQSVGKTGRVFGSRSRITPQDRGERRGSPLAWLRREGARPAARSALGRRLPHRRAARPAAAVVPAHPPWSRPHPRPPT